MALLNDEAKQVLVNQLMRHEGVELNLYQCTAGKQTIGVGRNLDDMGITQDEAMYLLNNDVERVEKELKKNIHFLSGLSDNRKIVLINMAFNLGINRLLKFKNMLGALGQHDYAAAADEMLNSKWAEQVGSRANELAENMRTG